MSGTSGVFPPGVLLICNSTAYAAADNVTVESNERVEVTFPGGELPVRIARIDFSGSDVNCRSDRLNGDTISFNDVQPPFTWNVDTRYNLTGMRFAPGNDTGTPVNQSYMNPGDSTIFIATPGPDDDTDWANDGLAYWTSPMYIVGNDPLPSSYAPAQTAVHTGLLMTLLFVAGVTALQQTLA